MDLQPAPGPEPLRPYVYPVWVWIFTGVVAIAVVYALAISPKYFEAVQTLRVADRDLKARHWDEAIELYLKVLRTVPDSKAARLGAAEAIFSDHDDSNNPVGMALLQGLSLRQAEWARVSKNMPPEYQRQFQSTPGH